MVIIAMRDYLRGDKWLYKINGEKKHITICKIKAYKIKNSIWWRVIENKITD